MPANTNLTLFFATNRRHEGENRWKPTGYGGKFSSDGHFNLRYGKVTVKVDGSEIEERVREREHGREGNGEAIAKYIGKQLSGAQIDAFKDPTAEGRATTDKTSSSQATFRELQDEMSQQKDVLLFVHGYNVSWNEAVASALALQCQLNQGAVVRDVLVVLFTWPSDGKMTPILAYRSDRDDARDSGAAIARAILKTARFLSRLRRSERCEREIHLLAHSMGNWLLQNALEKLRDEMGGHTLPRVFRHLFLCAADVDDDVFEQGEPMERLHQLGQFVTIYFNRGDVALKISDATKGNPDRLGHGGMAHPALAHNKVHQVDCSQIVKGSVEHSYYLWGTVNGDIRASVAGKPFDDPTRGRRAWQNVPNHWELT